MQPGSKQSAATKAKMRASRSSIAPAGAAYAAMYRRQREALLGRAGLAGLVVRPDRIANTCYIDECIRPPAERRVVFNHHYWIMRDAVMPPCSMSDCEGPSRIRGYCSKHAGRHYRYGSAHVLPAPPKGECVTSGYRQVPRPDGDGWDLEHRIVMEQVIGRPLREGETVHHINGDRLDNRSKNLELWLKSQPAGQRVTDRIADAKRILRVYGAEPEELHLW